jgi:hypothetical protein
MLAGTKAPCSAVHILRCPQRLAHYLGMLPTSLTLPFLEASDDMHCVLATECLALHGVYEYICSDVEQHRNDDMQRERCAMAIVPSHCSSRSSVIGPPTLVRLTQRPTLVLPSRSTSSSRCSQQRRQGRHDRGNQHPRSPNCKGARPARLSKRAPAVARRNCAVAHAALVAGKSGEPDCGGVISEGRVDVREERRA